MRIEIDGKRGTINSSLTTQTFILLNELPCFKKWQGRTMVFEPTVTAIEYLQQHFPLATWIDRANRLEEVARLHQLAIDGDNLKTGPLLPIMDFEFKTKPRDHQLRAFNWAKEREFFAFIMEMGVGKTKPTLDLSALWWLRGVIDRVLVLAPNGVHRQWVEQQIPEHMPIIPYATHVHSAGKRVPYFTQHKLAILSMNVEALSHSSGVKIALQFLQDGKAFVVVDESPTIKNISSIRSRNIRKLGKLAVRRAILSGAPLTRSIEDLYGQYLFLSPDALGFSSLTAFRNRYCDVAPAYHGAPRGVIKIIGHRNVPELMKKVEAVSFIRTKAECLDLPPKLYMERLVELTPEQRKLYNDMKEELSVTLENKTIDVNSAIVKIMRLQQIVCGFLPTENGTLVQIPSNRIKRLMEWLEDCGDKVIIWARFTHDIDGIAKALKGTKFARYDGQVPPKERELQKNNWLGDSSTRVMLANPAAAARGQNWQIAQDVAYYSNSFDADHRWQSEDRTHREGMKGACTYTDLIAPGTIDRTILKSLRDKKTIADSILSNPGAWLKNL